MLQCTIKDLLAGTLDTKDEPYYIYIVRTEDAVIYVGQSIDPVERLLQHISPKIRMLSDQLGELVWENRPISLSWQIELLTPLDCEPYRRSGSFIENIHRTSLDIGVDLAESALIMYHRPCLNKANNPHPTALPSSIKVPRLEPGLTEHLY